MASPGDALADALASGLLPWLCAHADALALRPSALAREADVLDAAAAAPVLSDSDNDSEAGVEEPEEKATTRSELSVALRALDARLAPVRVAALLASVCRACRGVSDKHMAPQARRAAREHADAMGRLASAARQKCGLASTAEDVALSLAAWCRVAEPSAALPARYATWSAFAAYVDEALSVSLLACNEMFAPFSAYLRMAAELRPGQDVPPSPPLPPSTLRLPPVALPTDPAMVAWDKYVMQLLQGAPV